MLKLCSLPGAIYELAHLTFFLTYFGSLRFRLRLQSSLWILVTVTQGFLDLW
jgi:hypothetical protein